jgi:CRISPR-associated protein Csb2
MLTLAIEFLTGSAVLTDASSRERTEWPPHPARVFMALVAAHYENAPLQSDAAEAHEMWAAERRALLWLESAGAPAMRWPSGNGRDVVKMYVPVNDASVPANPLKVRDSELRSSTDVLPDRRSRQERTFPTIHVGNGPENAVYLYWPDAPRLVVDALARLAAKTARIGHSSSLVRVWIAGLEAPGPTHQAGGGNSNATPHRLRVPAAGLLEELDQRYNAGGIEAFFRIRDTITNGKPAQKQAAKDEYAAMFGTPWTSSSRNNPPVRLWPSVAVTAPYFPLECNNNEPDSAPYDSELIILTKQDGPALGLEATALLTTALRGYLLEGSETKPEWYTGHKTSGGPADGPHLAILPLAYVGGEHADGHVMGLALAIPSSVPSQDRAAQLHDRLFDGTGAEKEICLNMGRVGVWSLILETRSKPARTLRPSAWTAPSKVWASVTPVVLDRHPKHDPSDPAEREAWRNEVAGLIKESCRRGGLPVPVRVDIDKTCWFRGAPRSRPGSGGMPLMPVKAGTAPRQQIHVLLQFAHDVRGPLFLGAGRYRGYGLCKPLGPDHA